MGALAVQSRPRAAGARPRKAGVETRAELAGPGWGLARAGGGQAGDIPSISPSAGCGERIPAVHWEPRCRDAESRETRIALVQPAFVKLIGETEA